MNDLKDRLRQNVIVDDNGCWLWQLSLRANGYGQIVVGEEVLYAHRVSYEVFVGPIRPGKEIDHLCRVRKCINPQHIEAVSHRENMRRSATVFGENARKTHCKRGHSFDEKNTYRTPKGARQCRKCLCMHAKNARKKRKADQNG